MIKIMEKPYPDEMTINIMHPIFKGWFFSKFKNLSEPQKYSIYNIHTRQNTLISSPTGSGKTLSAFSAVLNELIGLSEKKLLQDKVYCIYISPLKALSRDIEKNLDEPLAEMDRNNSFGIRIGVRTGDTDAKEKAEMLKNAPHILITTPESLSIMLTSKKFISHLQDIEWCIVDEIHALADNKRGVHLSLSLELLSKMSSHMTRIGLSATVSPLEEVAKFLAGNRDCFIVDTQFIKEMDIKVISPIEDLIDTTYENLNTKLYDKINELVMEHKTTLVFTNTRAATERVVHFLQDKYPRNYHEKIAAHHGSLSKEIRTKIEDDLREGKLRVIVCSTSLELGIDIGYIDLVICLGSPKSVSRLLQRIGRSGHRLHDVTKGRVIVLDRDDLVECSVMVKSALEKKIDRIHLPRNCLDVLAQQIFAFCIVRKWEEKELFEMIKSSYCFADLKYSDYDQILNYLSGEYVELEERYIYSKIWRRDGMLGMKGKMSRVIFMTNVGTIPDQSGVMVKLGDYTIGTIDEGFLEKLKKRDIFVLGGKTYEFRFSKGMVAFVQASIGRPPTVPSWYSEMLPLSFDLAEDIQILRQLVDEKLKNGDTVKFLKEYLYSDETSIKAMHNYFKEQYLFCKIPNRKKIIIEHYFDGKNKHAIFHTLYGRRVNDCLSRLLAYSIARSIHKDIEIGINDNGFIIGYEGKINFIQSLQLIKSENVEQIMENALDKTEILKRRFRHCAARAMMILRSYKGKTRRVGKQQISSDILLSAAKTIGEDFFIIREAKREIMEDLMDITNTKKVLGEIEKGKIKVEEIFTQIPSPFAFNIVVQGYQDIIKIDDKTEFLRRMHNMVLAKISLRSSKKEELDIDYQKIWHAQDERDEENKRNLEKKKEVMIEYADLAMKRLNLDVKIYSDIVDMINGRRIFSKEFISFIEQLTKKPFPKQWPKDLLEYLSKLRRELKN